MSRICFEIKNKACVFFEKMTGRRNGEKLTEVFELENENIEIISISLSFFDTVRAPL